jgi:hypothetical protein
MASNSKKTVTKRTRRDRKSGHKRKVKNMREGSTPVFPIHQDK